MIVSRKKDTKMVEMTVLLAILMLLATVVYVYYTGQLLKETVELRKVETSPFINANIQIKQGFSFIVIKNIFSLSNGGGVNKKKNGRLLDGKIYDEMPNG